MREWMHGLLQAAGVGLLAAPSCGGTVVLDPGAGGASSSESAGSPSAADGSTSAKASSGAGTGSTGSGMTNACGDEVLVATAEIPSDVRCAVPEWAMPVWVCFDYDDKGGCDYPEKCVLSSYDCGLFWSGEGISCGPLAHEDGACCYLMYGGCAVGRPLTIGGEARTARATSRADWAAAAPPIDDDLDEATRAALADYWTREALTEHASVASFSRFVLQLLAVGAPAELVSAAQHAAGEELEHARLAFGFAARYGGKALGPSSLDVRGALDGPHDLVAVAKSVAREGAIAETVSAALVRAAADACRDEVVSAHLRRVAEEELQHATLAWRFLRWALTHRPALRSDLAPIFARARDHVGFGPTAALPTDEASLRRHGYTSLAERRRVAEQVLREVVAAASEALLGLGEDDAVSGPVLGR